MELEVCVRVGKLSYHLRRKGSHGTFPGEPPLQVICLDFSIQIDLKGLEGH